MQLTWNNIHKNKPAIFDWLVFALSLLLALIFPSLGDIVKSTSFSVWMLVSLVLYVVGILLKRGPLYGRLAIAGKSRKEISYLLFLIIGHWIIMLSLIIFAEEAFRAVTGMQQINPADPVSGYTVFTSIVTSAFITWVVFKNGRKKKTLYSRNVVYRELAGDLILLSAVTMITFIFWEKTILEAMGHMSMDGFGSIMLAFIFLSFAYILFYMPLRYLYLVEEYSTRQTFRRLLLIYLLILIRAFIEVLLL